MIYTPILIFFLIIVFVLAFMFINTIDDRKWITIPVSLIVTPFLYFFAFYPLINIFSSYHHQKYFDAKVWTKEPSFRYEMFDNMQETDTLVGMSKTTIKNLLGTYEWLSWDDAKDVYNENSWNYGLGIHPGAFNSKSEAMEIIFVDNKVKKVKTFQLALKSDVKK